MHRLLLVVAVAISTTPAAAHDFWLQPRDFWVDPGAIASVTLQVGHGPARQRSPIPVERILSLRSTGLVGTTDQRTGLGLGQAGSDAEFQFSGIGLQVLSLETDNAVSNLPAIRFNDYLSAEGLTPAIEWRGRTGESDQPGREFYRRRAKALIQVGPLNGITQPQATKPVGLSLEIVPERNPYELDEADFLPVIVFYEGRPLPGALVKLTDLGDDTQPIETHRTDANGRAAFTVHHDRSWLLNVIWTQPLPANRQADYVTTFSSLAFGFPTAEH